MDLTPPIDEHFRRALLETIPCAVFMVDADGRILFWNRSAAELTGYAPEQALGRSVEALRLDMCNRRNAQALQAVHPLRGGCGNEFECEIRRADGRVVPVMRRVRPVLDDAGRTIGAIEALVDVSPIRSARTEIRELRAEIARAGRLGELVGSSEPMQRLFQAIQTVAATDAGVVIEGETGTGKELVARAIHQRSGRGERLLLAVNCGALPETLLEAELFGHVKGAFTGAAADRRGRFEEADGGTLLLDEVAELPLASQVKLLRVLQEGEVTRLGENRPRRVDVRILAATNVDLAQAVREGRFREDLFYRLRVVGLQVPALRGRREDIPELVGHFLARLNTRYGRAVGGCEAGCLDALMRYDWPGNVRQLEHALEHALVVTPPDAALLGAESLPAEILQPRHARPQPADERAALEQALARTGGNKAQAARLLGITRAGLYKKLRRLGL